MKDTPKRLKGKKFLICGGSGFMGSNFIHFLMKTVPDTHVVNLDALTYAGNPDNLLGVPPGRYRFKKGDICDEKLVGQLMKKADFVINFAAETHVDRSIHSDQNDFIHTNILGVHSLLKAFRKAAPSAAKMIHVSTDEVWGDLPLSAKGRFSEKSPFRPNSPYAASKAAGDLLIRSYTKTYGVPVIVCNSVNFFGPRQFPEKLIPFFTLRAMENEPLPLYGNGKNIREWIHVEDYARALLVLCNRGKTGEIYLASSEEGVSNISIARRILKILKKPESLITFVADRPGHDRKYAVNTSKLRALGWSPRYSITRDLSATVNWYAQNTRWVQRVLGREKRINAHIRLT
jgi:dTDP-glucose 4,6-dehydratase